MRSLVRRPSMILRRKDRKSARSESRIRVEHLEERCLLSGSYLFDFGTNDSPVESGAIPVASTVYNPNLGHGWTHSLEGLDRGTSNPLTRDFNQGIDNTFQVDLPNGHYRVTPTVGDAAADGLVSIWAEGQQVVSRLRTKPGKFAQPAFHVHVADGQLNLQLTNTGHPKFLFKVNALQIDSMLNATAGGPYSGVEGSPVTLTAAAGGGTDPYSYAWDLDNNGTYETSGQSVFHTFLDDGTYKVGLRVTDHGGAAAFATATVAVANAAPTASAGGPYTAIAGQTITFQGSATDPSPIDTAAGFTYTWNFGDGTSNSAWELSSPTYIYSDPGTYTVSLTATDRDGATSPLATTTVTVSVPNVLPLSATAGGPYTGDEGSSVVLSAAATGGIAPYSYAWDLENNGTYVALGESVSHTFLDNGVYTVGLRVMDGSGQIAFSTATVTVANASPTAAAGGPYTAKPGDPVMFHGSATDPSPVDTAAGFTYTWDFGDGSPVVEGHELSHVSHSYHHSGQYALKLTARDKDGGVGTATTMVMISAEDLTEVVWVEDALPAGAVPFTDGPAWNWVAAEPAPHSGALALRSERSDGTHQHYFQYATATLPVAAGDVLFAHVYLDPANVPEQVMLQWNDGTWDHRAYWGADKIGWGQAGTESRRHMGALPAAGGWVRLEVPASAVGLEGRTLNGMAFTLYGGKAAWDRAGVAPARSETVWVEDGLPAGAAAYSDGAPWAWKSTAPPPQSGSLAAHSGLASGMHQLYFERATATLPVAAGDVLFAHVYLDPANVPEQVMLQWNDGTWDHRAYWGADKIGWGQAGTASRRHMGALPAAGGWVRLEVPASAVGLEGRTLNGMAFTLYGGKATWDRAGVVSGASNPMPPGEDGRFIHTHHDRIPDYGAEPTIVSIASGPWSDPAIWSTGRVPTTGDIVDIGSGTTVIYDAMANYPIQTVEVESGGTLRFRTDISTQLVVANFLVLEGGVLEIGTIANPVAPNVTANIIIADQAIDTSFDPQQFGTGLIGLGKVTMVGAEKTPFIRLASEPKAGNTTLTLANPATGWRVGDRLALPDTRQLVEGEKWWAYSPQWETFTVQAISGDGRTVTLSRPLTYDHVGARDGDGVLEFLPHVMNLNRNVTIASQNPAGTRGHVMFTDRADLDLRHVGFRDLGRTTVDALDSTILDAHGHVTHLGTNQIGRYPLHIHHLMGPVTPQANGHQFTIVGAAIDGGDGNSGPFNKFKWGMAIHNSHYGLIQGNNIFNVGGSGFVTEDGNESYNIIERNFVMAVQGPWDARGANILGDALDGSAFWLHGFNNVVRDNVAANASNTPQGIVAGAGYNLWWSAASTNTTRIPLFPGADLTMAGQYELVNMQMVPILEFARNEAYGAMAVGLTIFHLGTDGYTSPDMAESVIQDFRTWHAYEGGFFGYPMNNVTFDGFVVRGHPRALDRFSGRAGWTSGDYWAEDVTIRNADIQGMMHGFADVTNSPGTMTIENSYLRNYSSNIVVQTLSTSGTKASMPPRQTRIINTRFDPWQGAPSFQAIEMRYNPWFSDLTQTDEVFVYSYNGVAGDDFQLYYEQQAADFIVPKTDTVWGILGSPEAGLTNQQNWDKYGIAIAGAVAPANTTRRPGIHGLIRKL